jgi:DNA-binding FadR family transcriptional regulator
VLASGPRTIVATVPSPDAVTALLERTIREASLRPGDRLPTERELAATTGAGRAAVRRALGCLEAKGRVVRQVGRGTFLAVPAEHPAEEAEFDVSPIETMAVRAILEPGLMPLAAVAANGADFSEMERCLAGEDAADDYMEWEAWDAALHRSLVLATHNSFLVRIGELVSAARLHPAWGTLKRRNSTPGHLALYRRDHRTIVQALVERDADLAQRAMQMHLQRVRGHLLGDHGGTSPFPPGEVGPPPD